MEYFSRHCNEVPETLITSNYNVCYDVKVRLGDGGECAIYSESDLLLALKRQRGQNWSLNYKYCQPVVERSLVTSAGHSDLDLSMCRLCSQAGVCVHITSASLTVLLAMAFRHPESV